ncbi:MAG: L,D-transpeptidase family protein [Candidatus Tectomicrobia bacterium]|uniref:L,D-transpeptidase family protein n=1 Tax=Tectimicrobiota bacterium TaxID=2528274 RepID=A0A932CLD2_UNCTE|nr:L,D-transpeptidase family protein [Candidatus Tectomicrobia bacterium]
MKRFLAITLVLIFLVAGGVMALWMRSYRSADGLARTLRSKLPPVASPSLEKSSRPVRVDGSNLDALTYRFYSRRGFQAAWMNSRVPGPQAGALLEAVRHAGEEGLDPADYPINPIQDSLRQVSGSFWSRYSSSEQLVDLDILLTKTFLLYASDLSTGRVRPQEVSPVWHVEQDPVDLVALLGATLKTRRMAEVLTEVSPPHLGYVGLKAALARYAGIAAGGGWPIVPEGPVLRVGERGPRVRILRQRLTRSGDLASEGSMEEPYDPELTQAVRHFQERHGLEDTGMVEPETLAELNLPVEKRMKQIILNMERWRWIPRDLGRRYLLVNIPGYDLKVVEEEDRVVMEMRIIVGRTFTPTPIFNDQITYLFFHPTWNIPQKIAAEEILPAVQKDPDYLGERNIRVFDGFREDAQEIDPATVDWSQVDPERFPYALRQDPGPKNPLGRVKFGLPNPFDIYLHDTPAGHLFQRAERGFSHGCIRVEEPGDLAGYLLKDHAGWSRERVLEAFGNREPQIVKLDRPFPVHILYWTAWVEEDGTIQFREDIYGFDQRLQASLGKSRQFLRVRQASDKARDDRNALSQAAREATGSDLKGLDHRFGQKKLEGIQRLG